MNFFGARQQSEAKKAEGYAFGFLPGRWGRIRSLDRYDKLAIKLSLACGLVRVRSGSSTPNLDLRPDA